MYQPPLTLKLPDLETFKFGTLEDLLTESSTTPSIHSDFEQYGSHNEVELEDLWSLELCELPKLQKKVLARTWERFRKRTAKDKILYITEAGPRVWDAAVKLSGCGRHESTELGDNNGNGKRQEGLVTTQDDGFEALISLGLGLQSSLFIFEEHEKCQARVDGMTLSGLSVELSRSLIEEISKVGTSFRTVAVTTESIYARKDTCSTKIAVAETVNKVISVLKKHLTEEAPRKRSILQLRGLFQRSALIVQRAQHVMDRVTKVEHDEPILNEVYHFVEGCENGDAWFQPIARQMLARISRPWLDALEDCLHLRSSSSVSGIIEERIQVLAKDHGETGEAYKASLQLPQFLGTRDKDVILQTCQSLELLKDFDKGDVLTRLPKSIEASSPVLNWKFGWQDIERIQAKAKAHKDGLMEALGEHKKTTTISGHRPHETKEAASFDPFGRSLDHTADNISLSFAIFEQSSQDVYEVEENDALNRALTEALCECHSSEDMNEFSPPFSLIPSISFSPIISSQSRLVNLSCLRMLIMDYNLLYHFRLQHTFQLLGSGTFITRLTNALFSPTRSSTERRKGHTRAGTLGLRLGSRSTWPPASSELRLALMGILTESFLEELPFQLSSSTPNSASPPISFAVRSLSEPEIHACLDPSSLQALDFLRLQYKPPPPISYVITDSSLDKYDRAFKLLLRVSRVLYIATEASTSGLRNERKQQRRRTEDSLSLRLRLEMMRFVGAVAGYIQSSIQTIWSQFERTVENLAVALEKPDILDRLGEGNGMHRLRALHEAMLDEILFALLLRKRQEPVMAVLEDILGMLLEFSNVDGAEKVTGRSIGREKTAELHKRFGKKVSVFVAVCKGLSEKGGLHGAGGGRNETVASGGFFRNEAGYVSTGDGAGIEALVVRLNMNGWYDRKAS